MTAGKLAAVSGAGIAVCWAVIMVAGPGRAGAAAGAAAAGLICVVVFLAAWRRAFRSRP